MDIGFVGLGLMGRGMAARLVQAGHQVTVFNRSPVAAEALARHGATVAATPAAAARGGLVITMLANDAALEQVTEAEGGILAGLPADGIHITMSTVSVALVDRLAAAHREAGSHLLSAPVFGRPEVAAAGKLSIAASGDVAVFERVRPVLETMSAQITWFGDKVSAANLAKLAGNFMLFAAIEAMGEAFALLRKGDVAVQPFYEMTTSGLFGAPVYRNYGKMILDGFTAPPGFTLPLALKDASLVEAAAVATGTPMPFLDHVRDQLQTGINRGFGELDVAALALIAAEDAGLDR